MTLTRFRIVRIRPTSFLLKASTHAPKKRDSHAQTNIKRSERKYKHQMSRNLDGVGVSLAFPARSVHASQKKKKASLWMMQRFKRGGASFQWGTTSTSFRTRNKFLFSVLICVSYLYTRREATRSSTGTSPQTRRASASSPSLQSAPKAPQLFSKMWREARSELDRFSFTSKQITEASAPLRVEF